MRPADFLDIAVITIIIYFALLWLRQQASRSVAVAITAAGALYLLARQTDMYLTSQLFKAGFTAALVALVLIFQQDIPLTEQCLINKPSGLTVNQVMPRSIRMRAYHMQEISLPVKVVCAGSLPGNLSLAGVKADPETLRILVPASRKADYSELKTEALALGDIRRSDQVRLNVVLPEHAQFVDGKQASVVAKIEVTEKK